MRTDAIVVEGVVLLKAQDYSCAMGESSGSSSLAIDTEHEITTISAISAPVFRGSRASSVERREGGSFVHCTEERIERSKRHWTSVSGIRANKEVAKVSNVKLFRTLQRNSTWGTFFMTFGDGNGSYGKLVMGKKFAEGGQAKLFEAHIEWNSQSQRDRVQQSLTQFALKVFKKGTFLRDLQVQWPLGMLHFHAEKLRRERLGLPQPPRFHTDIVGGTLLRDGRFAFLMVREEGDLRSFIDRRMLRRPKGKGRFSKKDVEIFMYEIAHGMDQLHNSGIVHRDIKASNVLISKNRTCYIADFECSGAIVGTGFFRAPEILEACKNRSVTTKPELFTKVVDVYSYGMTCYEILTGKLPFEGHLENEYDLVLLKGQRPELPEYVDDWIRKLLKRCWRKNPISRPTFREILNVIVANSTTFWNQEPILDRKETNLETNNVLEMDSKMEKLKKSLKMVKLQMMSWIGGNTSS